MTPRDLHPQRFVDVEATPRLRYAGIVDDDVETSPGSDDFVHRRFNFAAIGNVDSPRQSARAALLQTPDLGGRPDAIAIE